MKIMQMSRLQAGPVNLYCYRLRQFEVKANIRKKNTPVMLREYPLFISVAGPTQAKFLEGYFIPSIYLCLTLELVTETMCVYICMYKLKRRKEKNSECLCRWQRNKKGMLQL